MSGDVQPRKRKDKKRKKDEGGYFPPVFAEESRGTAAALGEGDVLMHTHSDHGTGGHWCAKLVFFLLLAVLVGLVGLILMENRGLSDLEAANTESRYAAVFDGWVDEALPDDHHHDEHTLELTNAENDEHDEHGGVSEEGHEEEDEIEVEDIEKEPEDSDVSDDDHNGASDNEGIDSDGDDQDEIDDEDQSTEAFNQDEDESDRIVLHNKEVSDEEIDDGDTQEDDDDDDDYLENKEVDDDELDPIQDSVEALGSSEKPFEEVDSSEDVTDQEEVVDNAEAERELEQRRAEEQQREPETSNLALKVGVGVALVVVAHCVLVRKWQNARNTETVNNFSSLPDRRQTLLPDSAFAELTRELASEQTVGRKYQSSGLTAAEVVQQDSEEDDEDQLERTVKFASTISNTRVMDQDNDDDYLEEVDPKYDEDENEDIKETEILRKINDWAPKEVPIVHEPDPREIEEAMSEEEVTDPKELISEEEDEELLEEEVEEVEEEEESEDVEKLELEESEAEEEEVISDVDDDDLMKKLEMKYGKLQNPQDSDDDSGVVKKPGGGLSAEEAWPNEPDDKQWRDQLNLAQAELDEGLFDD